MFLQSRFPEIGLVGQRQCSPADSLTSDQWAPFEVVLLNIATFSSWGDSSVLLSAMSEHASLRCGNANIEKHTCCRCLKLEGLPHGYGLLPKASFLISATTSLLCLCVQDWNETLCRQKKKSPQRTAKPLHDGLHVKLPVKRALNIDCGGWEALSVKGYWWWHVRITDTPSIKELGWEQTHEDQDKTNNTSPAHRKQVCWPGPCFN